MTAESTWIVVADAARARIFARDGEGLAPQPVTGFTHPDSREKARDIATDRPGRTNDGTDAYMPGTDPQQAAKERFATRLARWLEREAGRDNYSQLVLVAPPAFLGELRDALDDNTRERVVRSIDRNLSNIRDHELVPRLQRELDQR
jgi:protein required for attachment to host cells